MAFTSFTLLTFTPVPTFYFKYLGKQQKSKVLVVLFMIKSAVRPFLRFDAFSVKPQSTISALLLHVNTDCYHAAWTPACPPPPTISFMLLQTRNVWKSLRFQCTAAHQIVRLDAKTHNLTCRLISSPELHLCQQCGNHNCHWGTGKKKPLQTER